ncbi:hypothetical protein AB4Y38_24945 [Paraburkholderia sp. EG285A]|uniref:hypothetical protein n=1 Tax=Paraburkholderia sp. EG285A TaxID=3237009 RepID=UPI0034D1D893
MHAGNRHTNFENEFAEHLPDLSIALETVQVSATRVAGLTRRLVYDYAHTRLARRMTQMMLLPGTQVPAHRLGALVDIFVLAGDVSFVPRDAVSTAKAGDFVVMEPGTQVCPRAGYGTNCTSYRSTSCAQPVRSTAHTLSIYRQYGQAAGAREKLAGTPRIVRDSGLCTASS